VQTLLQDIEMLRFLSMAAAGGLLLASAGLPATAQTQSPTSCSSLQASNPAAYEQLCGGSAREFPEYTEPVLGDGDTEQVYVCGMLVTLQPGQRVRLAGC
jgi:hypothetical protein